MSQLKRQLLKAAPDARRRILRWLVEQFPEREVVASGAIPATHANGQLSLHD